VIFFFGNWKKGSIEFGQQQQKEGLVSLVWEMNGKGLLCRLGRLLFFVLLLLLLPFLWFPVHSAICDEMIFLSLLTWKTLLFCWVCGGKQRLGEEGRRMLGEFFFLVALASCLIVVGFCFSFLLFISLHFFSFWESSRG
jgi:hypothetical protein